MPAAIEHAEVDFVLRRRADQEVRSFRLGSSDFEVRRARAAERPAAEQGSAEIRAPATGTGDDATRRMRERSQAGAEDSGFVQDLESMFVSGDVKLVARCAVEGTPPVRADLGRDTERTQKAERATSDRGVGDVHVYRHLAAPFEVNAPGRVEQPRELCEPIALAARRDRR